jgi:phosphate-selective porin OprO and OprP
VKRVIWLASVAIACLLVSPMARAGDATLDQDVLDVLRDQGLIDQKKYEELSDKARKEEARKQAEKSESAQTPAVSSDPEAWSAYWKNGFHVDRNDGLFKLKFGGRIQLDAGVISPSTRIDNAFNTRGSGFDFRRVRIFTEGDVWDHGVFKAQFDFAGSTVTFDDVYVGLRDLPAVQNVWLGHFKEYFSLEELTSSKYITFMERSLPVNAFAPSRNVGLGIHGTALDDNVTWGIGGFREVGASGEGFSRDGMYNMALRLTGTPFYADDGEELVHLGLAYTHKFRNNDPITFSSKPEANQSAALASTGTIMTDGVDELGLEFAGILGPLSLQSEFMMNWTSQSRSGFPPMLPFPSLQQPSRLDFYGAYAEVSYFLTGEHRAYEREGGHFGRVSPKNPFSIGKGGWGAWELAFRWSYLDLSSGNVRGGIENDYTGGINWYLYPNLRLMFNAVYANAKGRGDQMSYISRVSFDF